MFERYTEKARRVIFFARYEASQFGSPYIETEHLLLGLLREDKALTNRLLALSCFGRIDPQADRGAYDHSRKGFDLGRSAALERMQAGARLRGGRSRAAGTQAHRHGTSAAWPAARREVLCRGDPAGTRAEAGGDSRRAGAGDAGEGSATGTAAREQLAGRVQPRLDAVGDGCAARSRWLAGMASWSA